MHDAKDSDEKDLNSKVNSLVDDGEEVLSIEAVDTEIEDEYDKIRLTKHLKKLIKEFRQVGVKDIISDAECVNYKLNEEEIYTLTDFAVPTDGPSVVRCLETAIGLWFRLGMHLTCAEDLELSASNDLITQEAKSLPDPSMKSRTNGYNDKDRESAIELGTESQREYLRLAKRLKKRFALLVDCTKEYINVLKKMLDYYSNRPGVRSREEYGRQLDDE